MRLHQIRRVLRPQDHVFAYASDYANSDQWDPTVVSARQVEAGAVGVGTRYELEIRFGGMTIPITYEIIEYDPNYRVVLVGRSKSVEAIDELRFIEDGDNTVIDYTVNLTFHNSARFVGPLAIPFVKRAGARAIDALVAALEG